MVDLPSIVVAFSWFWPRPGFLQIFTELYLLAPLIPELNTSSALLYAWGDEGPIIHVDASGGAACVVAT